MDFEAINKKIQQVTQEKRNATLDTAIENPEQVTKEVVGGIGMVVSKPGSERILLDTTSLQLLECETSMPNSNKRRFCIVEKNTKANYGNQYINSAGERAHVITRDLFNLLFNVISNASKQIKDLRLENAHFEEQRDLYKGTIDTLRKNGIIE
jgi:hypothetical protein